jgi:hypothetical protein
MIENLTSWSKLSNINEPIWHHEQIEFWPHDQKFDLLKELNFDLMKFDLMIISLFNYEFYANKYYFLANNSVPNTLVSF